MYTSVVYALCALFALYALHVYVEYRQMKKTVRDTPGLQLLFPVASAWIQLFPKRVSGVTAGRSHPWVYKHEDFVRFGSDIICHVSAWPSASATFEVADADAIREITQHRAMWPKPVERYGLISWFGQNIVATEGEEWKKHRKISAPAFSEPNNKLVFSEAVRITKDLMDNVWHNEDEVAIDHMVDITFAIALMVLGSAAFGRRMSWEEDVKIPSGHNKSFKDALHTVSLSIIIRALIPPWAMNSTQYLRDVSAAFHELEMYMKEMVQERKIEGTGGIEADLLSNLLEASNQEKDGKQKLLDSEVIGNVFIFLIAGHETTAHTLSFTLGLLALYPDEQEILLQHILSVLPDKRDPTYEDMNALARVTAVFNETLRLFPPVIGIPKKSAEDTTLHVTDSSGQKKAVFVPKGADITLHTPGLHYNPRYWKDPYEFRPQRFLEDWPRDAFLPFSGGARSCLGRRFFEVEAVAILAVLLMRYKVEVKEEPQFASETFEQRKARILAGRPGLTLTPVRMPLVFKRRY